MNPNAWSQEYMDRERVENMSEEEWEVIRDRAMNEFVVAVYNLDNIARMDGMKFSEYQRLSGKLEGIEDLIISWNYREKVE